MIKCNLWWFFQESRKLLGENNLFWFCWERRCDLLWVTCFSALYGFIYYRVHFYIWIVWGLLKSFHVILLVLIIKSGWLEFFWKGLYFDFYEVHIRKGHIQEIEKILEPIYKKGKILYIYIQFLNKTNVNKTVHILLSFTFELNIL